jgi:hypothetical protein
VLQLSAPARQDLLRRFPDIIIVDDVAELLSRSDLDLDENGTLGVQAVAYSQAEARALPPPAVLPVPAHTVDTPARPWPPTSDRLTSNVVIGIIVVSGPTPDLQFSIPQDLQQILDAYLRGVDWLADQSPASQLSFQWEIKPVTVDVQPIPPPPPDPPDPHKWERLWRDPAMGKIGYSQDWTGVLDYVQALRDQTKAQWVYCAFFTKYPLVSPAYSSVPRIVVQYRGPDGLDRVFARETAHIFGAPYEDAASGCDCEGSWGYFHRPNGNCATCAPGGGTDCIMRNGSWNMCAWTSWHLGFQWPTSLPINETDGSWATPAFTAFNGKLYLIFNAPNPGDKLTYCESSDGTTWSPGKPINDVDHTAVAPAVAEFNGKFYVFFKADDPSNRIMMCVSSDGKTWSNGKPITATASTPTAPAAAAFKGKLYVFCKANDPSNRILMLSSSDGEVWSGGTQINRAAYSRDGPAAVELNGKLHVFFRGFDPAGRIGMCASSDGKTWSMGTVVNTERAWGSPAAAAFNDKLYVFFLAPADWSNRIMYCSGTSESTPWMSSYMNNVDQTNVTPAVGALGNNLYTWLITSDDPFAKIRQSVFSP